MHLRAAWRCLAAVCLVLGLGACSTPPKSPTASTPTAASKAVFHTVKPGETLTSIARRYGQSASTLRRLNKLSNPNQIRVGQVLRLRSSASAVPTSKPANTRPSTASKPNARPPAPPPKKPPTPPPAPKSSIALVWPATGTVNRSLSRPSPHGLFILNKAGTPVHAVASGQVIYADQGLRGYGNLLIVRHAGEYLSIYAHNRRLSVRKGQQVRQGQKIAEMGDTESRQVGLYFELRYQGKAISATPFLPPR